MIGFILHHTGTVESPPVWGEEVMARLFRKELARLGVDSEIINKSQQFSRRPDVTFHFSENMPVFPSSKRVLYLQNDWDFRAFVDSPKRFDENFDVILHASPVLHAKHGKGFFFRMPADPELYFPTQPSGKFEPCDIVYVSNNIKPYLNNDWLKPLGAHFGSRFRIYGSMWENSGLHSWGAPKGMVVPDLFASAKIVLSLHLEDHRRYNVTTCRIPEALLAGKPVISDAVGGEEFGDFVWYARDASDLIDSAEWILANYSEAVSRAMQGREHVLKHHTFKHRAAALLNIIHA